MSEPWFVEAFKAGYLDVYPHRDLESARREARFLVERGVRGHILDVCCGFGRHCLALRELGVDAFGLDLSRDLIARARDLSSALDGRIFCGDARALPVADASLDGAVSLFSSFGYFGETGDREVFGEIARAVRKGGLVVLDLMNPTQVRAKLVPASSSSRGGVEIEERRSLEDGGRRVIKDVRLRFHDGSRRSWREEVRLYSREELSILLTRSGFDLEAVHGDFDGSSPSPEAPRQIFVGRRR